MTYNDPPVGPRTASHPAAQTMDEAVDAIRMKPQQAPPVIHAVARSAASSIALIGALTAFVAGVALGKAL